MLRGLWDANGDAARNEQWARQQHTLQNLARAIEAKDHAEIQALIKQGADITQREPLLAIASKGYTELLTQYVPVGALSKEASLDAAGKALVEAASKGHTDTVRELARLGALPKIAGPMIFTHTPAALTAAAANGHTDTVKALFRLDANRDHLNQITMGDHNPLLQAAWNGHTNTVIALVHLGADIHKVDDRNRTALIRAAALGHTQTVEALVKLGAEMEHKDMYDRTALIAAVGKGRTETAAALVRLGAASYGGLSKILSLDLKRGSDEGFSLSAGIEHTLDALDELGKAAHERESAVVATTAEFLPVVGVPEMIAALEGSLTDPLDRVFTFGRGT